VLVIKVSSHSNYVGICPDWARWGGVLRKVRIFAALTAWMLATGSHWDFVQAFAWGRMIYGYSHTMTVADAVEKTFAPGNMCSICRLVERARRSQDSKPAAQVKAETKIALFCPPVPHPVVTPPVSARWRTKDPTMLTIERAAPPLPPPRLAVA
jgi:hypothetical protein